MYSPMKKLWIFGILIAVALFVRCFWLLSDKQICPVTS